MKRFYDPYTRELPLVGGVVQQQRLVIPAEVVMQLKSYRHACRLAWRIRVIRNMTKRTFAEQAGLYASHVTDYFSVLENRRELPARYIAQAEKILGNTVISQWVAQQSCLTVMEELQATRHRRAA